MITNRILPDIYVSVSNPHVENYEIKAFHSPFDIFLEVDFTYQSNSWSDSYSLLPITGCEEIPDYVHENRLIVPEEGIIVVLAWPN